MLLVSTLMQNCSCKHRCMAPSPTAKLVGFDSTERQAVTVKKFMNNGKFADVLNRTVYTSTPKTFYGSDTIYLPANEPIGIETLTDYIIEVPAAGRTFTLRNMSQVVAHMKDQYCTSGLKYTLNDVNYTLPANTTSNYAAMVIDLKK